MPEPARIGMETDTPVQEKAWKRQSGEPMLWFNRFLLYLNLGYKRTVQAAVEHERAKIGALKSTNIPIKKSAKGQIVEVPRVKVPGSWKHASMDWRWVERARSWDTYVIERMIEQNMQTFLEENHVLPLARIQTLGSMLEALSKTYNASNHKMTYEQDCMYIGRMQSLLRDIRDEMHVFDETVQRAVTSRRLSKTYKEMNATTYKDVFS